MKEDLVVNVSMRLSESVMFKLEQLAQDDNRTLSGYIRKILAEHVAANAAHEAHAFDKEALDDLVM